MQKKILVIMYIILLSTISYADVIITEIMYNPEGSDSGYEWIELFSDEDIDLTECKFFEEGTNHNIVLYSYNINNNYSVLTTNPEKFLNSTNYNSSLFSTAFSSLKNEGEPLSIICGGIVKDNVTYNNTFANGDGNSLQLINSTWIGSLPTPGAVNVFINDTFEQDLQLEVNLDDETYLGLSYTSLFKITNLAHISGIDDCINVTVYYNITQDYGLVKNETFQVVALNSYKTSGTGSFFPEQAGNYTLCGVIINSTINDTNSSNDKDCKIIEVIDTSHEPCSISINITTEKLVYNNSESIKFYNNLNNTKLNNKSLPYQIEYWIEDLHGNIIKNKVNTTNTNQKSYTPNIDDLDMVLNLKSQINWLACNDSNLTDNSAEKIVVVRGIKPNTESSINITTIYLGTDNKVKFGESLRVKAEVYKGDETKDQLKAYIEDASGNKVSTVMTTMNLYKEFTEYELTIPIQIEPNCKEKYPSGTYYVVLEAFDVIEDAPITIEGISSSNCITTKTSSSSGSFPTTKKAKFEYELESFESIISPNKIFSTKVKLTNNDKESINIKVWSYVYRGSKSYSGEREENMQEIDLAPGTTAVLELKNSVEAEEGDYKFKVKIRKDDQKTTKDITKDISVVSSAFSKRAEIASFYTRSTKANDAINLYANIKNPDGQKLELNIESFDQSLNTDVQKDSTEKIEVNMLPGKNIFFAVLKDNDQIYDIKQLILGMDEENIFELEDKSGLFSGGINTLEQTLPVGSIDEIRLRQEPIVIYESSSYKARKLIAYFIILLSVLLNVVLVWKR